MRQCKCTGIDRREGFGGDSVCHCAWLLLQGLCQVLSTLVQESQGQEKVR